MADSQYKFLLRAADFPRLDRRMVKLNGEVVVYGLSSGVPLDGPAADERD